MAFTPKKFKTFNEQEKPVLEESVSQNFNNETVQNLNTEQKPLKKFFVNKFSQKIEKEETQTYNGVEISTLEKSGIHTPSLTKFAAGPKEQNKINIAQIDKLPIKYLLQYMQAIHLRDNLYTINDQTITIKEDENKWYNTTLKRGNTNNISLVKHLTARKENMSYEDERMNDKTLFVHSIKYLNQIEPELKAFINEQLENPVVKVNQNQTINSESDDEIRKRKYIALINQLDDIPLNLVMEFLGASPNADNQRGKWKVHSTGHNIQVTGQQWKNWNSNRKGSIGAISLMAHHIGISNNINESDDASRKYLRNEAIKQLKKAFANDLEDIQLADSGTPNYKEPFCIPHVIPEKFNVVRDYLHDKRKIPNWIISKQFNSGFLYAGFPSDWEYDPALKAPEKLPNTKVWATFLSINGNAAELRAVERKDEYAKLLAKGSDKEVGGFLIKAEKEHKERIVTACEAAVDTMSYHALYPGRIALSCMGVNFNLAVKAAIDALDNNHKFRMGFDNDKAGNEATVSFVKQITAEIGEDDFNENFKNGNIQLFELGMHCLDECIKTNQKFYFDVLDNDTGRKAFKLFYEQISNKYGKETLNKLHKNHQVKYLNLAPDFYLMTEPKLEAQKIFDLLNSGKPYYLLYKNAPDDEKPEITEKRLKFEHEFQKISIHKIDEWKKNGLVITSKQALSKDWNEFLEYNLEKPEFNKKIQDQEMEFKEYIETQQKTKKHKK